jgi:hypothetical protein
VFIWFQELRYQIVAFQGITKWSWPNVKIIITVGVYLTCGPTRTDPRPSGPRGQPAGRPGFDVVRLEPWLPRVYTRRSPSRWRALHQPAGYMAWSPNHYPVPNWPLQVSGGSIHPYKYPHGESQYITLILQFSTCKCSSLGVVAQEKPCQESRVESSVRLSSRCSPGDRWALVSLPFFIDFES